MKLTAVRTVMRRDVVTAQPEMSLYEAAESMYREGINGLPVVDEENRVVGVVGIKDILRVPFRSGDEVSISTATPLPRIAAHLRQLQVRDIMAPRPLCVRPDDPLSSVVGLMVNRGIHPIPVVDNGRHLVGLVGRADVLGAILRTGNTHESGAPASGVDSAEMPAPAAPLT